MSDLFIYGSNNYGGSSVSSGISVCSGGTALFPYGRQLPAPQFPIAFQQTLK